MNIIELLKEKNYSIATAESLTAGLVGSNICSNSGASSVYKGGVISYTKEAKCSLLGLDMLDIEKYNVYSHHTVLLMAKGVKKLLNSSCAIATSGVAGPGSDEGVEEGTVFFAYILGEEEYTECVKFSGTRNEIRDLAAKHAVDKFVELIIKK